MDRRRSLFGSILKVVSLIVLLMGTLTARGDNSVGGNEYNSLKLQSAHTQPNINDAANQLLNTGKILSVIGEQGRISQFTTPPATNPLEGECKYLNTSGIWFGAVVAETLSVSTAAGYPLWSEFTRVVEGAEFPYNCDYSFWTLFTDTVPYPYAEEPNRPLNIRCVMKAYCWIGDPNGNAVLFDLIISNMGDKTITDGYVGIYIDSDVGYKITEDFWWNDDLVGSLPDDQIIYFIDNDGDPYPEGYYDSTCMTKILAAKFLCGSFDAVDTSFNWWLYDQFDTLDYGPRRADKYGAVPGRFDHSLQNVPRFNIPISDEDKYFLLGNGEWDYDLIRLPQPPPGWETPPIEISTQYLNGELKTDVSGLLSIGPADIPPDSSIRVFFTYFTGDSVHTMVNNIDNLPENPDLYLADLNFNHVIANAALADSLVELLLDPQLPVTGLRVRHNDADSAVIEWDPWVFEGIEGYEIVLYEVPDDSLPYSGVLPPWLKPDISAFDEHQQAGLTYHFRLDSLIRYHHCFIAASHILSEGIGEYSQPVHLLAYGVLPPPEPVDTIVYFTNEQPAVIEWAAPPNIAAEHYNIYKFNSWYGASRRFRPFYDFYETSPYGPPRDSFFVDDTSYYYFSMVPYIQVAGDQTGFSEFLDASAVYVITAVDSSGYESAFSNEILALNIFLEEKDILVITSHVGFGFVEFDSVVSFYDSILQGYDYEIYNLQDSIVDHDHDSLYLLRRKLDFCPYRLVIFEDGLQYQLLDPKRDTYLKQYLQLTGDIDHYLESGGTFVYCGFFGGLTDYYSGYTAPGYRFLDHWFTQKYFGVDSVFQIGVFYYHRNPVTYPVADTLVGFSQAICLDDTSLTIAYNLLRYPFPFKVPYYWDRLTPPAVGAFYPNYRGRITHVVASRYPETSLIYSHPIGVKTEGDNWTTYAFGFHLWYMDYEGARALIDTIFQKTSEQPEPVLPDRIALDQNFPNPFNAGTKIRFYLPWRSDVRLDIYNILGQKVLTLLDQTLDAGEHVIIWDGTNSRGRLLATGVYFYRLKAGTSSICRKMILLK